MPDPSQDITQLIQGLDKRLDMMAIQGLEVLPSQALKAVPREVRQKILVDVIMQANELYAYLAELAAGYDVAKKVVQKAGLQHLLEIEEPPWARTPREQLRPTVRETPYTGPATPMSPFKRFAPVSPPETLPELTDRQRRILATFGEGRQIVSAHPYKVKASKYEEYRRRSFVDEYGQHRDFVDVGGYLTNEGKRVYREDYLREAFKTYQVQAYEIDQLRLAGLVTHGGYLTKLGEQGIQGAKPW